MVTVLPTMVAPARRSIATMAASLNGMRPAWMDVPYPVGMSWVSKMSLTPTAMPASGPSLRAAPRQKDGPIAHMLKGPDAHIRGRDGVERGLDGFPWRSLSPLRWRDGWRLPIAWRNFLFACSIAMALGHVNRIGLRACEPGT